jgi:hypothetical protein
MSCCEEQGFNCRQGRDCPVRATRRVRAGQPAPPLMLDPEHFEKEEELSDSIAAFAVLVIILIVGACAALVVGVI